MRGAVSAAHGLASTAGLRILIDGGNAVDAAVATGAALGVVEPFMSGIGGGGGFMLDYEARTGQVHALDYVGRTPSAADPTAFASLDELGTDIRASATPGTLGRLARRPRTLRPPRSRRLFQPAIDLAEHGWPISPWSPPACSTNSCSCCDSTRARATYFADGQPPVEGEVVRQPDLARSYRQVVAEGGADASIAATLGERLVRAIQRRPAAG